MVGTDILEIDRLKRPSQSKRFMERVFTPAENSYYAEGGKKLQILAGMFCAKEAVAKALGCGFAGIDYHDIEIAHDNLGKPYVNLYNKARKLAGGKKAHISISHCKKYAVALCVLASDDNI